ncbi:MAG: 50S ribosomal protein L35 [bacterium]
MPKLKTHKSASKRFRITASGKLNRRQAMQAHKLTNKSASRKRRLGRPSGVASADTQRIRRMMGR